MSTQVYEPRPDWQSYGNECCQHCGQLREAHHPSGRCYSPAEMATRLAQMHEAAAEVFAAAMAEEQHG